MPMQILCAGNRKLRAEVSAIKLDIGKNGKQARGGLVDLIRSIGGLAVRDIPNATFITVHRSSISSACGGVVE